MLNPWVKISQPSNTSESSVLDTSLRAVVLSISTATAESFFKSYLFAFSCIRITLSILDPFKVSVEKEHKKIEEPFRLICIASMIFTFIKLSPVLCYASFMSCLFHSMPHRSCRIFQLSSSFQQRVLLLNMLLL